MSELEKYKLNFEKPRVKRRWISQEVLRKMAKNKSKQKRGKLVISMQTYVQFAIIGLPISISIVRESGTVYINTLFFETAVTVTRMKE